MRVLALALFPTCIALPPTLDAQLDARPSPWSLVFERYAGEGSDHHIRLMGIGVEAAVRIVHTLTLRPGVSLLLAGGAAPLEGALASDELFNASAVGLNGQLGVQWSPLTHGPLRPFLDGTGGLVRFTTRWPPQGSYWNFACRWGGGVAIRPGGAWVFTIGWRHAHVSNGRPVGPENPTYDGHGIAVTISRHS
jgi:hypothetical protein